MLWREAYGERGGRGGKLGQTFRSPGKERGDMKLSCIFHVCRGSHRRRRGDPLFSERRNFFSRLCTLGFFPGGSEFFFCPAISSSLFRALSAPSLSPSRFYVCPAEDGGKVPCLPPFFLLFLLNLNWMRVVCRVEKRPEAPSDRANWRRDGDGRHEKRKG